MNPDRPFDAVELAVRYGKVNAWLAGAFVANRPTLEGVRIAASLGHVAGETRAERSRFAAVHTLRLAACHGRRDPGVAPALVKALAELGSEHRHLAGKARGLAVTLAAVADILGDGDALWERLLGASTGSPFARTTLPVPEAAAVYRTRWAEARARRDGKGRLGPHDFCACVIEHDVTARHSRDVCPTAE